MRCAKLARKVLLFFASPWGRVGQDPGNEVEPELSK